jgi:hypothetical protein
MKAGLTIVIPVRDESSNIEEIYFRIRKAFDDEPLRWSILFVDDASGDDTFGIIKAICRHDERVRCLRLAASVGQERAILAGLRHCPDGAIAVMDGDLQDPPEILPRMVRLWKAGHDVVLTRRSSRRGESLFKRVSAGLFYRLIRATGGETAEGNFYLVGENPGRVLRDTADPFPLLRLRIPALGHRLAFVRYDREPRHEGRTKYSIPKMWALAMDGITATTRLPVQIGYAVTVASLLIAAALALLALLWPGLSGAHRLAAAVGAAGFVLLSAMAVLLALLGEHIVRLSTLLRSPPTVVIAETVNIEDEPGALPARARMEN